MFWVNTTLPGVLPECPVNRGDQNTAAKTPVRGALPEFLSHLEQPGAHC